MMSEQVVLLATGDTEKLSPLSKTIPSPMVPIANRPVMAYTIELLARQQFDQMVVCLHHLAGHVEAFFGQGQRWGVSFDYVLQRDNLGSAGSLNWAKRLLTGTFVVVPGDAIIDLDLEEAIAHHRKHKMPATVVVHASALYGAQPLALNGNGLVVEPANGSASQPTWYDTNVYIFEPEVLDLIPDRTKYDIHKQLIPALLAAGIPINSYQTEAYWNALNNFHSYYAAQSDFLRSAMDPTPHINGSVPIRNASLDARRVANGIWIGRNTVVHPTTRFALPVYIGDNCLIGRDAELGPNVVIGKNVIVDDEATISHSTIMDNTYVGQLVRAERRVVNKGMVVDVTTEEHVDVVDEFLLGSTHQSVAFGGLTRFLRILIAVPLLLLALPLFLLLGILSFLTTGRVFRQTSHLGSHSQHSDPTQDGESTTFNLIRFSIRDEDGRLRFLGSWMERLEWHRLPELLNVIKGDLVLVGVKPLLPGEAARLTEAWQQTRNECRAGFTGLWYIQTARDGDLDEVLIADAYYVATHNWRGDLQLLWKTPRAWLDRIRN